MIWIKILVGILPKDWTFMLKVEWVLWVLNLISPWFHDLNFLDFLYKYTWKIIYIVFIDKLFKKSDEC